MLQRFLPMMSSLFRTQKSEGIEKEMCWHHLGVTNPSIPAGSELGASQRSNRVSAERRTLFVFDFDCTLTSIHMLVLGIMLIPLTFTDFGILCRYYSLAKDEGLRQLRDDPTRFYMNIFGGADGVERLRELFSNLASGRKT